MQYFNDGANQLILSWTIGTVEASATITTLPFSSSVTQASPGIRPQAIPQTPSVSILTEASLKTSRVKVSPNSTPTTTTSIQAPIKI